MSSIDLLPAVRVETGDHPTHTILWMHGLGADGNDFVPIVKQLKLPPDIHIRFIFPHAPTQAITINNGFVMRAWYDIYDLNHNGKEDEAGIKSSQLAINSLIAEEVKHGIKIENIVLAGFSQGGAIALQTGLQQAENLAGILALSCYLPLAAEWVTGTNKFNSKIPILMLHGHNDSVIPITLAEKSKDQLCTLGCDVEWHAYEMEHSVCDEEIIAIGNWLKRVLR